jgi:hypothetical protein
MERNIMVTANLTQEQVTEIVAEAQAAARQAALDYIQKHGEDWYCGFAWVNIWEVKGNTKLGKMLKAAGVKQDYTKAFQIWNPSGHNTQSMSVKEAGAYAAAEVLKRHGFTAYAGSRAD